MKGNRAQILRIPVLYKHRPHQLVPKECFPMNKRLQRELILRTNIKLILQLSSPVNSAFSKKIIINRQLLAMFPNTMTENALRQYNYQ